MAYCTQADVEAHTGYGYTDFKKADATMTAQEWAAYIGTVIAGATQQINRYCNRVSFEETEITEYHNGRGPSGNKGRFPGHYYREIDRTFLPLHQPVLSVDEVHVDTGAGVRPGPIEWELQTPRDETTAGEYAVLTDGWVTRIRFHTKVPLLGYNNVKIVYTAGYDTDTPELADIKLIALDLIANILGKKKREQEAIIASWATGAQDGANMIQQVRPEIMPEDIQLRLKPYVRHPRGNAWH